MKKFYGLSLLIIVMMCVGWVKSSAQNYRYEWGYDGDNINTSPWYGKTFDNSNPLGPSISGDKNNFYYGGANAYVCPVAYRGMVYDGGFKTNSSNTVEFTVPRYSNSNYNNPKATVTIAFFIRNDQAESKKLNITIDETEIPYTITYSEQSNGYAVITTTLSAGTHKITNPNGNNAEVGIFYIRAEYHISGKNSVTLKDYAGTNLGIWKKFSTENGMDLYLGGWKYQNNNKVNNGISDYLTRGSTSYYDQNYDPEYDYDGDDELDPSEMEKIDDWGNPAGKYKFGNEDPYIGYNNQSGTRIIQPTMDYNGDESEYVFEYNAYNSTDNGRNEYLQNGYLGTYSFTSDKEDQGKQAKGDPFTVPCMGDFIKLEPTANGTVKLYLLQNATIDFDADEKRNADPKYKGGLLSKACWRPLYIVDEAGTRLGEDDVIAETNTWITIGRGDGQVTVYDSDHKNGVMCRNKGGNNWMPTSNESEWATTGTNYITVTNRNGTERSGYYIPAKYSECVEKLTPANQLDFFKKKFWYDGDGNLVDVSIAAPSNSSNYANGITPYVEVWPNTVGSSEYQSWQGAEWRTRVWGPKYTGDGWLMISKGYVTYEFKVQAGKSYYIFSNSTKIGFCGYDFNLESTPSGTITLNENGTITQNNQSKDISYLLNDDTPKSYANVKLNRTFQPGWNAICLPFSVHEDQMRKWFCKGTKSTDRWGVSYAYSGQEDYELVTYNGVGRDTDGHLKAFFFHHVYQDIIAGYPYMLYIPEGARALHPETETEGLVTFTYVTIEPNAQPLKEFTNSTDYMPDKVSYHTIAPEKYFTFKGFYSPAEEAAMASQGDYYVLPSGLQLYNDTKESRMKGLRAFMHLNCDEYGAKQMVRIAGTNYSNIIDEMETQWKDATVINEIAEEMGLLPQPSNIYNLSGQLVRQNSVSLIGLPKGVYIVNGKKQLVK